MKTNLPEITKAYLGSAAFFSIAGEGLMMVAERYHYVREADYLLPALVGFSLPALPFGFYLAGRVAYLARPPARARPTYGSVSLFETLAAYIAPQPKAPPGGWTFGGSGKNIKYKPERRQEFIFWEQGMDSMITEFKLFRFCKVAWRRQQQVLYRELSANQIFSRDWYTQEARPRWPLPEYRSIMHILESRYLVINRWSGKGGELLYPPYSTVEEAKLRWDLSKSSS